MDLQNVIICGYGDNSIILDGQIRLTQQEVDNISPNNCELAKNIFEQYFNCNPMEPESIFFTLTFKHSDTIVYDNTFIPFIAIASAPVLMNSPLTAWGIKTLEIDPYDVIGLHKRSLDVMEEIKVNIKNKK